MLCFVHLLRKHSSVSTTVLQKFSRHFSKECQQFLKTPLLYQGCKRNLFFRERDETFEILFETFSDSPETETIKSGQKSKAKLHPWFIFSYDSFTMQISTHVSLKPL